MKYTLLIIASIALIFAACKKKSTPTHCYVCNQYDSLIGIGGWIVYPNGKSDTQCEKNQGLMDFYVKTHQPFDTFFRNTDSQKTGYTYFRCEAIN